MKKALALILSVMLVALTWPATLAAAVRSGGIVGQAVSQDMAPLGNLTVRVRNLDVGTIAASGRSNVDGTFSFSSIAPGDYSVELLDSHGQLAGTSALTVVMAGSTATANVVGYAASPASPQAPSGGFWAFLSNPLVIAGIVATAIAVPVAIHYANNNNASPSR